MTAVLEKCFCRDTFHGDRNVAGVLIAVLAVLHAAALILWLYLLAKSKAISSSTWKPAPTGQMKKISVTYDLDPLPAHTSLSSSRSMHANAGGPSLGPSKRNRSIPCLATEHEA